MAMEIWVVPFFGQGHMFPCIELSKHIASRGFKTSLVISSNISSSVPLSLLQQDLLTVLELSVPPPPPPQPGAPGMHQHRMLHSQMGLAMKELLSAGAEKPDPVRPVCVVIDVMMSWSSEIFQKFRIPTVAFFTSGACAAAMEYAAWKADSEDIQPGEVRLLPGLPEDMALTYSDLKRRPHGPPGGTPPGDAPGLPGGPPPGVASGLPDGSPPGAVPGLPPKPGHEPPWVEEVKRTIALMINTCDDLERPFIDYIAHQMGKPVWGVGPLLPEQYWRSAGSVLHDREIRSNRNSNVSEDEVIKWLDSKPRVSVLYISFGTEVGPTTEEYQQLAAALEASTRPFIWVIQSGAGRPCLPRKFLGGQPGSGNAEPEDGYFPHGLDSTVGDRGLIIHGWAPQLLILSHPSTGGFLSHCGWNSAVEAIGRGVPFLAWPIRGDQYYVAKLVVSHLKVGYMVAGDLSQTIKKEDIEKGIERLMGDEEVKRRAAAASTKFQHGFPATSVNALDAFRDFINQRDA